MEPPEVEDQIEKWGYRWKWQDGGLVSALKVLKAGSSS